MAHTYGGGGRIPASGTTTAANLATDSINLPAGTTVLWVSIVVDGTTARAGGAPTYNGLALTAGNAKTDAGGTPETCAEDWYLLDPPTGSSYTLSIPNTNTRSMAVAYGYASAAADYKSVYDAKGVTTGSSTNPTGTLTVTDGAIWFAAVGNGATTWSPSARSGTQINDWDAGAWGRGAQYGIKSGTGSQTTSWTFATSEDWVITAASFKEVHRYRPYLVDYNSNATSSSSYTVSLAAIDVQPGDVVIVSAGYGRTNASISLSVSGDNSGSYSAISGPTAANDTWCTIHGVFGKVMGATPDATITVNQSPSSGYGGAATVSVWRNVDPDDPFYIVATPVATTNSARGNPPSVTPTVEHSVVYSTGAGSQRDDGSAFAVPSGMTAIQSLNVSASNGDLGLWQAYDVWTSGAYDPAAWTGGSSTIDSSAVAHTLVLRPISLGLPVGLSTETDTALALAGVQRRAVGLSATTETALALAGVQRRAVGLATETDTALALLPAVSGGVGTASETDTALALAGLQRRPAGLATETGIALALQAVQRRAVGLATETDTALALTGGEVFAIVTPQSRRLVLSEAHLAQRRLTLSPALQASRRLTLPASRLAQRRLEL